MTLRCARWLHAHARRPARPAVPEGWDPGNAQGWGGGAEFTPGATDKIEPLKQRLGVRKFIFLLLFMTVQRKRMLF